MLPDITVIPCGAIWIRIKKIETEIRRFIGRAAGMKRMGFADRHHVEFLPVEIHASRQWDRALYGLEVKSGDDELKKILAKIITCRLIRK